MKSLSILIVAALITSSIFGAIISTSSTVSAINFTPTPVPVRSSANVKESLSMSVSDDGRIHISWAEKAVSNTDIMYSFSSNNGTTFSQAARVNKISTGTQRNSEVATDEGSLFVVWEDGLKDSGDIILSHSTDQGQTFNETHISQNEQGTQSYPTLAASGDRVAVAWEDYKSDNTIRIWNGVTQGVPVKEISGHLAAVRVVQFSPNGTYLASCSEDRLVKIWNTNTWTLFRNITAHTAEVTALNWSADGKMMATGSLDHNVTLFDTTDFSVITKLNTTGGLLTKNFVNAISFSPDSSQIAVAYNGQYGNGTPSGSPVLNFNLTVWNLSDYSSWTRNGLTPNPDMGHSLSVMDVAFSHNGTYLASGGKGTYMQNTLKIWNSSTGQLFKNININQDVLSLSWSPDDRHVAVGLANGSIALVNLSNAGDIQWMIDGHNGRVNSIDWSTVRNEIVSGASDPVAKVWDQYSRTQRLDLSGHSNSVFSVDWNQDAQFIATAGGISNQFGMGENQIFCAVSDDGGLTFSSPVLVSDSCSGNRLRPKAGIDPSGNISIVWYDSRSGSSSIYFANSTDSGASFSKNIGIDTFSGDCSIPDIFVDGSGVAHVVWQYSLPPNVRYANSTDNFSQSYIIAANAQHPHVTGSLDGSSLWVSYRQQNQTTKLNYTWGKVSYNNGYSFTDTVILNFSNKFVGEHSLFVDKYNQTHVAWELSENPNENIYHRSTVLSDAWGPSVLSTSPSNGALAVSIFTSFTIRFSEPMNRATAEAAFSWTDGTTTWAIGDCDGNQASWNLYGDTATFVPRIPLLYQKSGYLVRISTSATDLAGNALRSSTSFSFATSADTNPPEILYYPSVGTVSYNTQFNVSAQITDQWGTVDVNSVRLFYQGVGDTSPVNSKNMTLTNNDVFIASIPAQQSLGKIYYYIQAADAFNNIARNPVNYTNHSALYNVSVIDGVRPEISHVRIMEAIVFSNIEIWAVVTDHIQLQGVSLNYRSIDSVVFTNTAMLQDTNGISNIYRYQIPQQISIGKIQYNITAIDSSGNFNSTDTYSVQIIDRTPPLINSVDASFLENQTKVLVRANVTDDVGINSVVLYFKAVGGNQWVSRPMAHAEGDYYEFTIPAQSRSGVIYYYVNATDIYGNQASSLSEQDQFQVEVVGVGSDYSLYYLLGGVLASLLILMVYLVIKKFSRPPRPSEDKAEESIKDSEEIVPDKVDEKP